MTLLTDRAQISEGGRDAAARIAAELQELEQAEEELEAEG